MHIRAFEPRDAADWTRIFHAAVHGLAARDYSAAQLRAWSPDEASPEVVLKHVVGHQVWVAVDKTDRAQALIELEADGHIDCFYCHPSCAGQGVGGALYAHLEAQARMQGLARLYVEASAVARGFFERQGFVVKERREFALRGVNLLNYAMEKHLSCL